MRGQVKQWWGRLTGDDLDHIDGAMDRLAGALQERYGGGARKPIGRSGCTSSSSSPRGAAGTSRE